MERVKIVSMPFIKDDIDIIKLRPDTILLFYYFRREHNMSDNKCGWEPKFLPSSECYEPSLPNDPNSYCILHSKKEDKELNLFTKKVTERIKKGTGMIDLIGCYFPKNFSCDYFIERTFDKPVYFIEAIFSNKVNFSEVIFLKLTDFRGAKFLQWAYFVDVEFTQWVLFSYAEFSEVYFLGTTFKKSVDFSNSEFQNRAHFMLHGKGKKVVFEEPSLFQYTRFLGEIIFQDVDLSKCSFLHSNIDRVDFRYCTFGEKKNRIFRIICAFPIRYIEKVSQGKEGRIFRVIRAVSRHFFEVFWEKDKHLFGIIPIRRQNVLRDELECEWKVKRVKRKNRKEEKKVREEGYEYVRRLYLELKRNLENKRDWNTAGDFHFGEMECRRHKMNIWWWRNILSLEAVYYWASGYGERPFRAFICLIILVLGIFPLFYMLSEGFCASVWRDSISVSTLMRLGNPIHGDTAGWGKFTVVVFELVFVPIQIALLALALRRKVKR